MRIDPVSSLSKHAEVVPTNDKARVKAREQNAADFAASANLVEKLKDVPSVRAEKIAAAQALLNDPNYPNDAVLKQVASVLTDHLKPQSSS